MQSWRLRTPSDMTMASGPSLTLDRQNFSSSGPSIIRNGPRHPPARTIIISATRVPAVLEESIFQVIRGPEIAHQFNTTSDDVRRMGRDDDVQ